LFNYSENEDESNQQETEAADDQLLPSSPPGPAVYERIKKIEDGLKMAGQNPNIEKQAAAEGLDQRYKSLCCLEKMRKN
jgi:hypothetical protein